MNSNTPIVSTKTNRIVLLYDKPRFYHTIIQLKELRELPDNFVTVIEVNSIDKFIQETSLSPLKYDHFHICIEYTDNFEADLGRFIQFLKSSPKIVQDAGDIAYHIHFQPSKKWADYTKSEIDQYRLLIETLRDVAAEKVVHCSIVNKYDMDTVYITEKDDLAKLGNEIQSDIQYWKNLKILDYGESSIRFLPGVNLPDTLEVLNIGGGYALETLAGFKMPARLKSLLAGQGAVHSIDQIKFPPTLQSLEIEDNKIHFLDFVDFPDSLIHLDVSQNRIEDLREVRFPRNLQYLNVGFNPIDNIRGTKFPETLKRLEVSNLPNESMTGVRFPESLEVLNLQASMTNTRGLKLPSNLRVLILSENGVNSINPLKLPNSLEVLYLNNNNIKTLSKVQFPPKLRELYIGANLITTLKNVIFPPTMEVLDLENDPYHEETDKQILTLKDVILPPNLKVLKLGYHAIKSIEIFDFPQTLRYLSLAYNELRVIRNVRFGNSLKTLDLSGNTDLISLDNSTIPESVTELRVSPQLIPNLPAYIIERANKGRLILKQSVSESNTFIN
ncbi:unnamed protein product [Candida verbasci]|uniref:Uncharacterized protein n=1 Tax=Candida verbasci TaxID=1227364 RepID=A0A9W4TVW4_9ASCO|nr:unnamed protein product [Candida verbasci]